MDFWNGAAPSACWPPSRPCISAMAPRRWRPMCSCKDAQNSPQLTTLAGPWAQPTQPLPITPQDDPEGEPIGTLQGALEDMQGRFNLNNLAHVIQAAPPTASTARRRPSVQDPSLGAIPAAAGLGRRRAQVGGHGARLDRRRRYTRQSGRRRRPGLHLADSALPHRQLAHDVAQRIDESARDSAPTAIARSRPMSPPCRRRRPRSISARRRRWCSRAWPTT